MLAKPPFVSNRDVRLRSNNKGTETVLIDVDRVDGKPHNQDVVQRYGNPIQFGLPVIVVLDSDGKQLTTQDTGKLERGDRHDPKKVMAFLEQWRPKSSPRQASNLGSRASESGQSDPV